MSEEYEFYVKVILPDTVTTFQCNKWNQISNGVELADVKRYKDGVIIINSPVVITTEIHGGVGAALV